MDADPVWPPAFLEEFEMPEVVGAGGMARVYRAVHRALGRPVAIKLLAPQAFSEEDSKKRFERERDVARQLKDPHIVPLLSYGDIAGRPYLVFEFVEGESLRDVLLRERRLPLVRALRYARHVAQGLVAAHAAGIVHRDLKPDNVLLSSVDDEARVADFGLARETRPAEGRQRLTQAGIILGTPGYLPPEMIRGEPAGPASDLFSLGVMLYEMITGYLPLDAGSEHELLVRYLREDLPPLSARGVVVPQRVERIVGALLRRDVTRRAAEADKVVDALKYAEAKGDTPDGPSTREGRSSRPPSRGSALTRPVEGAFASRIPPLTPLSGARFLKRHPGISAAALIVMGALIGGALTVLAYLTRPVAAPRPLFALAGSPTAIAGVTSALVRWQTAEPMATRLAVWRDDQSAADARSVEPPPGAPLEGRFHELRVRGLTAGHSWLCAPVFPDGSHAADTCRLQLRSDVRSLIIDPAMRYADPGHLEVTFEVKEEVTAGLLLAEAAGAQPVWAPSRGPRVVTLAVPLPPGGAVCQPLIAFRELEDDTTPEDLARSRVPLRSAPTLDALRRAVLGMAGAHPVDTHPLTIEMLRLAPKYYNGVTIPTTEAVKKLDEERRRRLLAEAAQVARAALAEHGVDLSLLTSALPLWREDRTLSAEERRHLHAALMRLSDIDGAGELLAGAPIVGFDRDLGLRQPVQPGQKVPDEGWHPLAHLADPAVALVVRDHGVLLFTHADFGASDGVVALWNESSGVLEALSKMALPDPADSKHERSMWVGLPDLPSTFDLRRPLRIAVQVSSLAPDYRLWLRIGTDTLVCFRTTVATFGGFTATPMKATRKELLEKAQVLEVALPAGYVEPDRRQLALKVEVFPSRPGGESAPMAAWVEDLTLIAGE